MFGLAWGTHPDANCSRVALNEGIGLTEKILAFSVVYPFLRGCGSVHPCLDGPQIGPWPPIATEDGQDCTRCGVSGRLKPHVLRAPGFCLLWAHSLKELCDLSFSRTAWGERETMSHEAIHCHSNQFICQTECYHKTM